MSYILHQLKYFLNSECKRKHSPLQKINILQTILKIIAIRNLKGSIPPTCESMKHIKIAIKWAKFHLSDGNSERPSERILGTFFVKKLIVPVDK